MKIYCCICQAETECDLTSGKEIYPHRPDLASLPFWRCVCGGYVGCHHKTKQRTKPLGVIASKPIKDLRMQIHAEVDPMWKSGMLPRKRVYAELSAAIGREYHTADLRSEAECRLVLVAAKAIKRIATARGKAALSLNGADNERA